jgi:hypothetical protein
MGEVVLMRDYKTKQEREIILSRWADRILAEAMDCAPCEMPPAEFEPEERA